MNPLHEWRAGVKHRTVLDSGCPHCYAEARPKLVQAALLESAGHNVDYHKTFKLEMVALRSLAKLEVPEYHRQRQTLFRMLYASSITALETYLSDAFYHNVINDDSLIYKLMDTAPEFKERKYGLTEVIDWSRNLKQKVSEYLFDIVWHNLSKIRMMYGTVLGVNLPKDADAVHRAVATRHDLVHRSGRTKTRLVHRFTSADIQTLFRDIDAFVETVEVQLQQRKQGSPSTSSTVLALIR